MPLDVAMQEPDTGVAGLESDDSVAVFIDHENVAAGRDRGVGTVEEAWSSLGSGWTLGYDLCDVAVDVERVRSSVGIVEENLYDAEGIREDHSVAAYSVDCWVCDVFHWR